MKNSYTKPNLDTKYFDDLFNSLPSMENKTVAITGTTSGLGFYAAESVAKLGAKVLLLNRPSTRAESSLNLLNKIVQMEIFTEWIVIYKVLTR